VAGVDDLVEEESDEGNIWIWKSWSSGILSKLTLVRCFVSSSLQRMGLG